MRLADRAPTGRSRRISLPIAQAASSMTGRPCVRRSSTMARQIARHAHLVHARIAFVRGVIAASIRAGSMLNVTGSMSTNTGVGAAVADRVGGRDERVADRDDLVAGPDADREQRQVQRGRAVRDGARVRAPTNAANSRSNAATSGPWVTQPERMTRPRRLGFGLADDGLGDRDLRQSVGHVCSLHAAAVGLLAAATSRPGRCSPSSSRDHRLRNRAVASPRWCRPGGAAPD